MSLEPGQVFAGYTIVRRLGAGGMGEVYLARHPRLPRHDAIKVLPSHLAADHSFRQRFLREADLAATLNHPNIVGVLDRGDDGGRLWLSMPFIEGIDASSRITQSPGGLPLPEVLAIVRDVAAALDSAHQRGVLHRDVKPANIMLDGTRALLSDFGIARAADSSAHLTATGAFVGSLAYASPEQLRGEAAGRESDVYSLAATAFALITGTSLVRGETPGALVTAALYASLPPASSRRPSLPPAVDEALARALDRDVRARTSTAGRFAADLSAALLGHHLPDRTAQPLPPALIRTTPSGPPLGAYPATVSASVGPRSRRKSWRTASVTAAVMVALVGGGLGTWTLVRPQPTNAAAPDVASASESSAPTPVSAPASASASSGAAAPTTRVASFTAVAPNGDPMPGFSVEETGLAVNECVRRNPSQFGPAPSSCYPSALAASLCWDSRSSVLCLADAWGGTLRRYGLSEAVQRSPYASVDGVPTRLTLADGRRCGIRLNSDQGKEAVHPSLKGYVAAFYCGNDGQMVWGPMDKDRRNDVIDKSAGTWRVKLSNGDVATTTADVALAEFATT